MYIKKSLFTLLLLLFALPLAAQSTDFHIANSLMQQQKYNEALPILQDLYDKEPESFQYANRLLDCVIQLKEYDRGLKIIENMGNRPNYMSQIKIREGELYHYKGEKEKAKEVWLQNIQDYPNQLQIYVNTAQTMIERREYSEAIEVYKAARKEFKNQRLFFGDIANAYLQAGEYEQAVNEWLNLLKDSPGQIAFIQRSLLRFDDPILYDIVIMELEEELKRLPVSSSEYQTFYQLQIWLLQENKLFRRALAAAKAFESKSSSFNYSLYNLGRQLSDNNQFELAKEAFSFYIENSYGEVKWRNMEELSNNYAKWAKYIDDHNLDFNNESDSLLHLSFAMLDSIITETNNYSRLSHIHLKKAELSLDQIFNLPAAEEAFEKLKGQSEMQNSAELDYLKGRIHLAKKEFSQARISFTKSNKKAGISELSEKTRYFLALTDFYAGDYEFATIQLKSLGRKNTSYYANDALELRLWLQEGLSIDTTGKQLDQFAEAVFMNKNGAAEEGSALFREIIQNSNPNPLKDDAILLFVRSGNIADSTKLVELSNFIASNPVTPLKEKLLWEQAKFAEKTALKLDPENCNQPENCLSTSHSSTTISASDIYEEIILQFPQGFYAPYARERLTDLNRENS